MEEEKKDYSREIIENCQDAGLSSNETLDVFYDKYNAAMKVIEIFTLQQATTIDYTTKISVNQINK